MSVWEVLVKIGRHGRRTLLLVVVPLYFSVTRCSPQSYLSVMYPSPSHLGVVRLVRLWLVIHVLVTSFFFISLIFLSFFTRCNFEIMRGRGLCLTQLLKYGSMT